MKLPGAPGFIPGIPFGLISGTAPKAALVTKQFILERDIPRCTGRNH